MNINSEMLQKAKLDDKPEKIAGKSSQLIIRINVSLLLASERYIINRIVRKDKTQDLPRLRQHRVLCTRWEKRLRSKVSDKPSGSS